MRLIFNLRRVFTVYILDHTFKHFFLEGNHCQMNQQRAIERIVHELFGVMAAFFLAFRTFVKLKM